MMWNFSAPVFSATANLLALNVNSVRLVGTEIKGRAPGGIDRNVKDLKHSWGLQPNVSCVVLCTPL